jgi:hypothetical protein
MPQDIVVKKTQTARFSEVVFACGQPEAFVPWTPLEKNKDFVKAQRENRLMTIKQEPIGTKKDFGVVGLIKGKSLTYLIFPKPLTHFENHRIVGINYGLVK